MFANFFKKIAVLLAAAITLSAVYVMPLKAQEEGGAGGTNYLQIIAENTTAILAKVNDFPNYMATMIQYALNMQKPDDSQTTIDMQGHFATIGSLLVQNQTAQLAAQPPLTAALLGPEANRDTLAYANDILYPTLLGQPLFNPDPRNRPNQAPTANPPLNYIKNAAGFSITHAMPRFNWRGYPEDRNDYEGYYKTVNAATSFNAYILSNKLVELQNGNGLTTAQMALITQATSSEWIAQIAAEEIGKVLRQLLMFQSQTYVLLTQLVQTQKELLTAQVINNGLLIALGKSDERLMLARAQRIMLRQ